MTSGSRPKRQCRPAPVGGMGADLDDPPALERKTKSLACGPLDRIVEIIFEEQPFVPCETEAECSAGALLAARIDHAEMRILGGRHRSMDDCITTFDQLPRGCNTHSFIPAIRGKDAADDCRPQPARAKKWQVERGLPFAGFDMRNWHRGTSPLRCRSRVPTGLRIGAEVGRSSIDARGLVGKNTDCGRPRHCTSDIAEGDGTVAEPLNTAVQLEAYGGPEALRVVDLPIPIAGAGEVRVRVLASSINYTETLIRRHLYPQTAGYRLPFVMGYDVVGEIDRLGPGVTGFSIGERVADMTVIGSDAVYRTLKAKDLILVPAELDPAEAATVILSWTTAYQLLHRSARVLPGQRILVHGAGGAVGQALLSLAKLAGIKAWGAAHSKYSAVIRELGATPIDYDRENFANVLPGGFDVVFDGIGEDGYRRSFAALKPGGLLVAIGYSAGAQAKQGMLAILAAIARLYLWGWLPGGKHTRFYSINAMRARHPQWFKQDLAHLFDLLKERRIKPKVTERIAFAQVTDAHRRLEAGGLEGKLVLCPG